MIADPGFIHLHAHTAFSLREGALTLGRLIALAEKDAQPALAVTDTNNLFAALEFSEKAEKAGVQAIPGVQLAVDFGDANSRDSRGGAQGQAEGSHANLVLLAKTQTGYRNLMRLCSRAYLGADPGDSPCVTLADLSSDGADLIVLTGGPDGALDILLGQSRIRGLGASRGVGGVVRRPTVYRTPAPRSRAGARRRGATAGFRLSARLAAGRDERAVLRERGGLRGP